MVAPTTDKAHLKTVSGDSFRSLFTTKGPATAFPRQSSGPFTKTKGGEEIGPYSTLGSSVAD